jgi:GTP cyclohydrolase I
MPQDPTKTLLKKAATTRFPSPIVLDAFTKHTREEKLHAIAGHIKGIMEVLGLDLDNDSLKRTPERVAAMYVDEVFSGLDLKAFPNVALFEDQGQAVTHAVGSLVITRVSIVSFCEHHLVPMIGTAYVGYLPKDKIIGLSKISRIARYFAARPQLQERLSAQIGDSLATLLGHQDVAVMIVAQHACVIARGAKDEDAETTTLYTSGIFKTSNEYRSEFLGIAKGISSNTHH